MKKDTNKPVLKVITQLNGFIALYKKQNREMPTMSEHIKKLEKRIVKLEERLQVNSS